MKQITICYHRHEIERFSEQSGKRPEGVDIAVALIILKSRHRLSNKCVSDILNLLNMLQKMHKG